MINPRNPGTLTDGQQMHLGRIAEAVELLRSTMHDAEGSMSPGEHQPHVWSTQHMTTSAIYLDIAAMFADKAVKET
jgi:hypothetical protein